MGRSSSNRNHSPLVKTVVVAIIIYIHILFTDASIGTVSKNSNEVGGQANALLRRHFLSEYILQSKDCCNEDNYPPTSRSILGLAAVNNNSTSSSNSTKWIPYARNTVQASGSFAWIAALSVAAGVAFALIAKKRHQMSDGSDFSIALLQDAIDSICSPRLNTKQNSSSTLATHDDDITVVSLEEGQSVDPSSSPIAEPPIEPELLSLSKVSPSDVVPMHNNLKAELQGQALQQAAAVQPPSCLVTRTCATPKSRALIQLKEFPSKIRSFFNKT